MVEQGTSQWLDEKLGVISGTRANDLMSSNITRRTLLATLIRELMTASSKAFRPTKDMVIGIETEPEAVSYYELMTGVTVTDQLAYIESEIHPMFACSPDGLIGDDGGYEGKRLLAENHLKIILGTDPEKKYIKQCEWCMFITGRKWWDLHYYCEALPVSMRSHIVRIHRQEQMMNDMLERATDMLDDLTAFLVKHELGGLLE